MSAAWAAIIGAGVGGSVSVAAGLGPRENKSLANE